jgi:hypothetical protein
MTDNANPKVSIYNDRRRIRNGASGGIYGLAFIGAVIYYLQHAATFGEGVIGVLKAIVWPVFLIYKIMDYLKM